MGVSDFKAHFSDCHCKLSFKILASFDNHCLNNESHLHDFPLRYVWNSDSALSFQETFAHPMIQKEMKQFLDEEIALDSYGINNATNKVHMIYEKVCTASLRKKKKLKTQNKKWFDQDLLKMKKLVQNKALTLSLFPKDPIVRGSFFKLNKQYSKLRKKKRRDFKQNILNQLDNLECNNPKEYWSLVNQLRNEKGNDKNCIEGDTWFQYFSDLTSVKDDVRKKLDTLEEKLKFLEQNNLNFSMIDNKITNAELQDAFSKLKSNKSPGLDNISNEMLKASQHFINPCLLKLFNAIFTSGEYPSKWSESFITPLFKSEDQNKPENYRGIAINNSIGKMFNLIMHSRLDNFLLEKNIIHKSQIGFSKNSRTSDHIFVLKCLINKYLKAGDKRLYTCFVDFRKAFDKVIHVGIMFKLQSYDISGYFYRILKSMYKNDRLCVKVNNKMTDFFTSRVGVRQGDVLSPTLFKLFINDLPNILDDDSVSVTLDKENIPCLLYADDLVLISNTKSDLQHKLNLLNDYCAKWCLEVNIKKNKNNYF